MKCSTKPAAIVHMVRRGMAKDISDYINELEAKVQSLTASLDDARSEIQSLNQEIKGIQGCFDGPPPSEQEIRSHLHDYEGGQP